MKNDNIKNFYSNFSDKIRRKKFNSPYALRRYSHRQNYSTILNHLKDGESVLEVGCGEGVLALLAAKKGFAVTAIDISVPNIESAKKMAEDEGVKNINFLLGDAENLPFENDSFDVVIADNVLEHLPNFNKGLSEIRRVARSKSIIVLPTSFNPCAWCLLGGDVYWKITRRTPYAMIFGFVRFIWGILLKNDGVNENYSGVDNLPHLWRYPWTMKKELERAGFKIVSFEAASICFPYFNFFIPAIKFLDRYKNRKILNNFGYGSVAVVEVSKN